MHETTVQRRNRALGNLKDPEEHFLQSIDEEIDRRQASLGKRTREEFFAAPSIYPASARGYWTRGVVPKQPGQPRKIKDPKSLVKFLRLLKPTIEIDARTEPWDRWRAGSKVIVLVGVRHVSIPKVSTVNQRAVGARDSQAFAELSKILYKDLGLDCEVVLQHVPANLPKGDSSVLLEELLTKSPDVGMVGALGSPIEIPWRTRQRSKSFEERGRKRRTACPGFAGRIKLPRTTFWRTATFRNGRRSGHQRRKASRSRTARMPPLSFRGRG